MWHARRVVPTAPALRTYLFRAHPEVQLSVSDLPLACCAVEFAAATQIFGADFVALDGPPPGAVSVLLVSGTLTDKLAPAVRAAYHQLRQPRYVVSFGACANSGGPYWDSYSVTKGVDQLLPVDLYVPGWPPRPEALRAALLQLAEAVADAR